jgi:hypothetical protein
LLNETGKSTVETAWDYSSRAAVTV